MPLINWGKTMNNDKELTEKLNKILNESAEKKSISIIKFLRLSS
ncbi:hypothetical protein NIES4072_60400 [Nostoc commune NIES-4072]|uniref:Uncharacterized protein n=1 Tax=Nostoc commune NIES-4072 TaxID=2005467 RepID=A0A2R5FU90_NOSCO|nr:hypothetical protein NIES4070_30550 [Nostoc commune HK-02]GBG22332.1 hypothetical protein NIES4072_60400 [Nostoc commune NIES-4072]